MVKRTVINFIDRDQLRRDMTYSLADFSSAMQN